jgi:hypothetical protein
MNDINYIEAGRVAGCPFCIASANRQFRPGERIQIISGSNAGRKGTIVDPPESIKNNPELLVVQMDDESLDQQLMVNSGHAIHERLPSLQIPSWAPPLSIRKSSDLHEELMGFCKINTTKSITDINTTSLYFIIWYVWNKRLPLEPTNIWNMMEAHGIPLDWKNKVLNISEHGLGLLITVLGKKPIKKYRVAPMTLTISKYGYSD